jgi:hypothetical protein
MLRLAPGATEQEAITRLSTLFEMMNRAAGFREAEVLRNTAEPGLLLVLHAWDTLEDWSAFQTSDTKIAFSSTRPAFLYNFIPCGVNWHYEETNGGADEGAFVRREVIRETLAPRTDADVASSRTYAYQDYEPSLVGATLRLTRMHAAPAQLRAVESCVLADEAYESLYRFAVASVEAGQSITAGR